MLAENLCNRIRLMATLPWILLEQKMDMPNKEVRQAISSLTTELLVGMNITGERNVKFGVVIEKAFTVFADAIIRQAQSESGDCREPSLPGG